MFRWTDYTQQGRLIKYLEIYGHITPLEAWQKLGIYRLADTVYQLRKLGYDIVTTRKVVKNKFGEKCRIAEYTYIDEV